MELIIKSCLDCPFHEVTEGVFLWCCYHDTKSREVEDSEYPPDWCPLRKENWNEE